MLHHFNALPHLQVHFYGGRCWKLLGVEVQKLKTTNSIQMSSHTIFGLTKKCHFLALARQLRAKPPRLAPAQYKKPRIPRWSAWQTEGVGCEGQSWSLGYLGSLSQKGHPEIFSKWVLINLSNPLRHPAPLVNPLLPKNHGTAGPWCGVINICNNFTVALICFFIKHSTMSEKYFRLSQSTQR